MSSPLDKIHVGRWPHEWTSELINLITVLRRLVELEPRQADLLDRIVSGPQLTTADLTRAGVFPVPPTARKPRHDAVPKATGDDDPDLFSALG